MPFQSSGIIVVDKTSAIVAASSATSTSVNNTYLNNFRSSSTLSSSSSNSKTSTVALIGGTGNQQQQQSKQKLEKLHEGIEHDCASTSLHRKQLQKQQFNSYSSTAENNNNLMRRHQRTVSSSSSSSSSSVPHQQHQQQNTKIATAFTFANQSNLNQMNQQMNQNQQHQPSSSHQHQSPTTTTILQTTTGAVSVGNHHQNPQIIQVSEEFIEHASFTNTPTSGSPATTPANIINLTTNNILNHPTTQIIKLVSDGAGGNVIIDSLGNVSNVTNGGHTTGSSSKLLVGNLTVLSKPQSNATAGQQQQTINFVNAKNLPYLTTNAPVAVTCNVAHYMW